MPKQAKTVICSFVVLALVLTSFSFWPHKAKAASYGFCVLNPDGSLPPKEVLPPVAKSTLGFFAYDPGFRGGVEVASGDVDGNGKDEIIAGAGFSGGPHVRLFEPYHLY